VRRQHNCYRWLGGVGCMGEGSSTHPHRLPAAGCSAHSTPGRLHSPSSACPSPHAPTETPPILSLGLPTSRFTPFTPLAQPPTL
jgi:hypothetical protein